MIIISKKLTGLSHDIHVDIGMGLSDALWLGDPSKHCSVENLSSILRYDQEWIMCASSLKAYKLLGVASHDVRWAHALGAGRFKQCLLQHVESIKDLITAAGEYLGTFCNIAGLLDRLEGGYITDSDIRGLILKVQVESTRSTINSMSLPSSPSAYDMCGTVTGRFVVRSGPRILTLPKRARSYIIPEHGGTVMISDFRSLEPRIASIIAGHKPNDDVYADMANNLECDIPRELVKLSTLSAMYGAARHRIEKSIGPDAGKVIRHVRNSLSISRITRALTLEYSNAGYIKNIFGRPIFSKDVSATTLYSHFIQSSANDTAMLGFSTMISNLHDLGIHVYPKFVIHDALVFELITDDLNIQQDPVFCHIEIDELGTFPIETSVLNDR